MIPYATLEQLKHHRGIESKNDNDDKFLLWLLKSSSEMIHRQTCRNFIPYHATLSADIYHAYDNTRIKSPDDVVEIEAITNGDGASVVGVSISEIWIDNPSGWKYPTLKSKVDIKGIWGYHEHKETMWSLSEQSPTLTSSTRDLVVSNKYSIGDVLKIDHEFMYVEEVRPDDDEITVVRGVNGTVASEHNSASAIFKYQQSQGIQWACIEMSAWFYKNRNSVNEYIQFASGGAVQVGNMSQDLLKFIKGYSRCKC